jgi:hypothetical protein
MSSDSSSDDLVWGIGILALVKYYVWTLTLCRIGHKPRMSLQYKPFSNTAIAHLHCTRCNRQLAVQTLPLNPDNRRDNAVR